MRKILFIIITTIAMLSLITVVSAATPEFDGDLRIRFQDRSGDTDSPTKGTFTITRIRLNAAIPIEKNISIFSRIAVEQAAGATAHSNGLYDTGGALDRWGVQWKHNGAAIKVGRQEVVLGQEGLVLTTLIDAVGEGNQLTGIHATWQKYNTSFNLIGGRLGSGVFQPISNMEANLYALQVKRNLTQRLKVGATYRRIATIDNYSTGIAHLVPPNKDVFNTYSLFGSYFIDPKTMVYTEFGRSNADNYNNGVGLGFAHQIDRKNSYSVNFFKQEKNSGLFRNWGSPEFARSGANTSWDGYALYYRYQITPKSQWEVSDYYEQGDSNGSANQFRITLLTSF